MYNNIPTVLRSQELLDKSLRGAAKIVKEDKEAPYRIRKTTVAQLDSIKDVLLETLEKYVKTFPNLEKVSSYERELLDIIVGVDPLKKAIARLSGALETIKKILEGNMRSIGRTLDIQQMKKSKKASIGRISSVIDELAPALLFLGNARDVMRAVPEVTPGDPTIVIAGYPNVGKSSLLAKLSKARPEIAPYPFTTKSANIGHFYWPEAGPAYKQKRFQAVDTPGLLEKPAAKRNYIEQQAVLALKYLADAVVFILDPSEVCGYDLPMQEKLLTHVREEFPTAPILVVENKADLLERKDSPNQKISCQTGAGISALKKQLVDLVPKDKYLDLFSEETPPA